MAVVGTLGASGDRPCMLHLVTVCSLAAFLFGYHVHEKALLHAAVSVSLGLGRVLREGVSLGRVLREGVSLWGREGRMWWWCGW